ARSRWKRCVGARRRGSRSPLHAHQCASALQRDCVRGKQPEERHAEIRHASRLAVGQDRDDAGGSERAARVPRRSAMENVPGRAAWLEDRRKVSNWIVSSNESMLTARTPMTNLYNRPDDGDISHTSLAEQLAFKSRFVLLFGEIDHATARTACERLIALSQDSDAPITMLISSPGGHVESGDAIHDLIRFVRAPVTAIGTGWVASAGTHV